MSGRSISFDDIAGRYDETRGGEERGEQFAPDIARLLRPARPVLEIGIGTGVIAKSLLARGFPVFGVDISAQMLARARERIGPRVVVGDATVLPVRTATVDQVVGVWVLHVVADVSVVMREVARVLRDDGTCLVVDGKAMFDECDPTNVAFRDLETGLGIEPRLGRAHLYARVAPEAGLVVEDIVTSGPHPFESSIAEVAEHIETRAHSWMWDVPDERWRAVASPVVARLRAHPDFARRVRRDGYQEILVLRRGTTR